MFQKNVSFFSANCKKSDNNNNGNSNNNKNDNSSNDSNNDNNDNNNSVSHFFIYFPDIGNAFLKQILHSGQWKRVAQLVETNFFSIIQILLAVKSFSAQCKFVFTANSLLCLVETDSPASGDHFIPISQISFQLEAGFPSRGNIFQSQWQRIFCSIKCRSIFKEKHYSCSLKPFSWIFQDIPASGSSFFRLVEMKFLSNPSQRLVYSNFGLISNHMP